MNILLLSAYDAKSHQYWRKGLVQSFSHFNWTVLTLPPRFFSWRVRGNGLYWSQEKSQELLESYDLVIATSMVDLATLRGLVPKLAEIPTLLYFHENQFAYPSTADQQGSMEAKMVSLYSALCATKIVFNSQYNRDTFISGVAALLKRLPDYVPSAVTDKLQEKSEILPVPVHMPQCFRPKEERETSGITTVVWNHRWEYDKGPDRLLAFLEALPKDLTLRFHIIGQQFKRCPEEMEQVKLLLESRNWLGQWGCIELEESYFKLLAASDVVLSTSIHDFQGLSIIEGMAVGLSPFVPDRLAYPEFVPSQNRYTSDIDSVESESQNAAKKFEVMLEQGKFAQRACANITHLHWTIMKESYRKVIHQVAGR